MPLEMAICLGPRVDLKIAPLIAPAAMLLDASCLPLMYPMYEFMPALISHMFNAFRTQSVPL